MSPELKSHFTQGLNRGDTDNIIWDCTGILALVPWLLSSQQNSNISGQYDVVSRDNSSWLAEGAGRTW